jgi:hypothetical protein
MALTLTESAKLSTNMVYKGVVQTAYTHSQILRFLPFMPIAGNAYQYARENAASTANVYDPGDPIDESTATFTPITTALKRIIGDAEIDEFAQVTRSDQMDQTAVQLALKVRAVAEKFESLFIIGDTGSSAKQFDGLRVLCTAGASNRIGCNNDAAAGATPTLDDIDRLIDQVKGPVDLLIMSQRSKRKLKALFRAAGSSMESHAEFGVPIDYYAGIPIATTNFIGDALTKGGSTDCSEIYALSLAEGFGVVGLQNEKTMVTLERPDTGNVLLPGPNVIQVGPMETKDAQKWRVRWYSAIAAYSTRGIACLDGVRA